MNIVEFMGQLRMPQLQRRHLLLESGLQILRMCSEGEVGVFVFFGFFVLFVVLAFGFLFGGGFGGGGFLLFGFCGDGGYFGSVFHDSFFLLLLFLGLLIFWGVFLKSRRISLLNNLHLVSLLLLFSLFGGNSLLFALLVALFLLFVFGRLISC